MVVGKPLWIFINLVEAAGVEPASEKARHEKNYVRFRFVIVGRRLRTGKKTTA
jgi:hypothetical protein